MDILFEKLEDFGEYLMTYSPQSNEERKLLDKIIEKWTSLNL